MYTLCLPPSLSLSLSLSLSPLLSLPPSFSPSLSPPLPPSPSLLPSLSGLPSPSQLLVSQAPLAMLNQFQRPPVVPWLTFKYGLASAALYVQLIITHKMVRL